MHRPHDTEQALDPHVAQWAWRLLTAVGSVYAVVIGVSILLGGKPRFTAPAYQIALRIPGAPWTWGIIILASGLLLAAGIFLGQARVIAAGGLFATLWSGMFSVPFAIALQQNKGANATGVWSYVFIAVVFMVITGIHLAMKPIRLPSWLHRKATT